MALIEPQKKGMRRKKVRRPSFHLSKAPKQGTLLCGVDCGAPITIDSSLFTRDPRSQGDCLDTFLEFNRTGLDALGLEPRIASGRNGVTLKLQPGLRAGAIPLKSPITGQVNGGIVINPRFGWPGVGRVLSVTGWSSGPDFLNMPLVPGSGREVPPWVLAGPVIRRLRDLLENLRPGYIEKTAIRSHPRGQIQWDKYLSNQMPTGRWHHLPCRFSELDTDSKLRQIIRWTLEKIHSDIGSIGNNDLIALSLIDQISLLLENVLDVAPRRPRQSELEQHMSGFHMGSSALRAGLQAIGWIVDERGLGGGKTSDGLAWTLPLEQLWERYVESVVRNDAAVSGGQVKTGRLGETVIPLPWSQPSHRALGHLIPDFVIHRHNGIEIVDAKYKSHFADLDETRWNELAEETQATMRADIHQILAYVATAGSHENIRATLIYPIRQTLFETLNLYGRTESNAMIPVGHKQITLSMKAIPFGNYT